MLISKSKKEVYEEVKILSDVACKNLVLCIENITWYKDDPNNKEISAPFDIAKRYTEIINFLISNYETFKFENIASFIEKVEAFEKYYLRYINNPNSDTFRQVLDIFSSIQGHQKEI